MALEGKKVGGGRSVEFKKH